MNYEKLHDAIVRAAKARALTPGYTERHHIKPRSMGGGDSSENIVLLTAREHYLVHWLLYKIHRNQEMAFAWHRMTHQRGKMRRYTSHSFSYAKQARARAMSALFLGKKLSPETKTKLSAAKSGRSYAEMGRGSSPLLGRELTADHKAKVGASSRGRKHSDATKRALSKHKQGALNPQYGKALSQATKEKISRSLREACVDRPGALLVEIDGVTKTASAWSRDPRCSVSIATVISRLNKGWPGEIAVCIPKLPPRWHSLEELIAIRDTYRAKLKDIQKGNPC